MMMMFAFYSFTIFEFSSDRLRRLFLNGEIRNYFDCEILIASIAHAEVTRSIRRRYDPILKRVWRTAGEEEEEEITSGFANGF